MYFFPLPLIEKRVGKKILKLIKLLYIYDKCTLFLGKNTYAFNQDNTIIIHRILFPSFYCQSIFIKDKKPC